MSDMKNIKRFLAERDGLRCAVTGEPVSDINELAVEHLVPLGAGGTDDPDNLILVKPEINNMIGANQDIRTKMLLEQLRRREEQLAQSEKSAFERERAYREQLAMQKLAVEETRSKVEQELSELQKERARYSEQSQQRVKQNTHSYVAEAVSDLQNAAKKHKWSSWFWSGGGIVALFVGIGFAIYLVFAGLGKPDGEQFQWPHVVFYTFKGLTLIALLVALAKYCFIYGQALMHESLKSTERVHAIKLGQFYLDAYGAAADWSQVKEAFEHWNISPSSAFCNSDPDKFDPKLFERVAQIVEAAGKLKGSEEKKDK